MTSAVILRKSKQTLLSHQILLSLCLAEFILIKMNDRFKYFLLAVFYSGLVNCEDCFDYGMDYKGFDLEEGHYVSVSSATDCQVNCQQTPGCNFWTWDPNYHSACWRKSAKGQVVADSTLTSGPKYCSEDPDPPSKEQVKLMSYNLFGWNALHNAEKTENLYRIIRAFGPDSLGCQEDEGLGDQIAANIGSDYRVAGGRDRGHSIIYRSSVFTLEASGHFDLSNSLIFPNFLQVELSDFHRYTSIIPSIMYSIRIYRSA